jgi:hypothetical protein
MLNFIHFVGEAMRVMKADEILKKLPAKAFKYT